MVCMSLVTCQDGLLFSVFSRLFVVVVSFFTLAGNVKALAMPGQFITFRRNVSTVNEQKVEIFILLLNSDSSAGTAAY